MMRVPSFALLCCCCCTHAELTGKAFRDPPNDHQPVFYDASLTTDAAHLLPDKNDRTDLVYEDDSTEFDANEYGKYDGDIDNDSAYGSEDEEEFLTTNDTPTTTECDHDHDHDDDHDHDHDHDHNHDHDHHNGWTTAQQWGYATLANSVVVSFSLCGIVIVKCTSGKSRQTIGDMFLGLCVSIMLGDGVMHIMPHFLGMNFSTI